MKLLLAIDDSRYSVPALRAVAMRPWPPESIVRLLTIVRNQYPAPFIPEIGTAANLMAAEEALHKEAQTRLQSVRPIVEESGLFVEVCIRQGDPGREIVEEAKSWGANLILMGSHGRTGLGRVLMGSVAQYVVAHAPCSVEVVRGPAAAEPAISESRHDLP